MSFILAILILGFGCWIGWKLGIRAGVRWSERREALSGGLHGPEREHLDRVLAGLAGLSVVDAIGNPSLSATNNEKKILLGEIGGLNEQLREKETPEEIRPVISFELGLAYIRAAMAEERENSNEVAAEYIRSAQQQMKSLGWRDCSEGTLREIGEREEQRRNLQPPPKPTRQ